MIFRPVIKFVDEAPVPSWWDRHNPFYVVGHVDEACPIPGILSQIAQWRFLAVWGLAAGFIVGLLGVMGQIYAFLPAPVPELLFVTLLVMILPKFQTNLLREMELRGQAMQIVSRMRLHQAKRDEEFHQSLNLLTADKGSFAGFERELVRRKLEESIHHADALFDKNLDFVNWLERRIDLHRSGRFHAMVGTYHL